ncbi:hypothetical protein AGABI1DRAFT_89560 [Agaricus bisporus var. burnettii JB137-S8]|uniref:DUF4218 domain-containing protein n=1 Tax=Agaricus bisporus var. burnettii (strain JB137-S8 / ATCC MYA-4627 / FGSC 10392) TaxID=597362 RepID=K5XHF7_AGABU|nr:uncharacterized protein AGABI1DRAFT_89560 [Agaricus bisporus var. burnettii JB137-S8]EKM82893.1 hypothetical protein AGABI1DRAFT_89560 [Agaricus bisporus var. burnettii JB137-S8]
MHLIWENLIPNLILFWTATFKELDHEDRGYVISPEAWKEVGEVAAACKATILQHLRSQMTSEMYSNWTLFIAPIVLRGRFQRPIYYKHFLRLVQLLKMCLELEIISEVLDQIDEGFQAWVEDYERLYYGHQPDRLSSCPLTIHALLHIAWGIRVAGPVWAYWAFPMERHCNTLLNIISSRRHPYASISAFVTAVAQLDQIRLKYNLHLELCLDPTKEALLRNEFISQSYPDFKLRPPRRQATIDVHLRTKLHAALATRFEKDKVIVSAAVDLSQPIIQYGKVTRLENGDSFVAYDMVRQSEDSRDASFIKACPSAESTAGVREKDVLWSTTTYPSP